MEHTSIEDFQKDHTRQSNTPSSKYTSRPPSFRPQNQDFPLHSIEHEYDEAASLSGSAHLSSGPDEAVFDTSPSRYSSPRTSHHSDDNGSISSFIESRGPSCPPEHEPSSLYTPVKVRSPFRNPSSVRAMQMETTPPPCLTLSPQQRRNMSPAPSRHGTPRSVRSSHRGSHVSPSKMSPTKKTTLKKEYPLVLLHVTLLPIPHQYSTKVMEQVLPSYMLENWKILREKATDTVLERGILIPHPKEDYDLMEERLLESLDLKTPRILKCGHFHLDPDDEADAAGSDTEEFDDEDNDADICGDCGRRVRDGRYGSGAGSRRWDIKVYAANGLMRSGAWDAAWREMERVDVEITPWMDEEVKRELASRAEEERKHAALLHEEAVRQENQAPTMDAERMREIYGDDPPTCGLKKDEQHPAQPVQQQQPEIPLLDLLKNYIIVAAQDRRNIAIFLLSVFILYLSLASRPTPTISLVASPHHLQVQSAPNPVSTSKDLLSTSTSLTQSIIESSVLQPVITSATEAALKEKSAEDISSASPEIAAEDPMDSVEARFEFAGE